MNTFSCEILVEVTFICLIAIAQRWTNYKIDGVLSACLCVCVCHSVIAKDIWGRKTKIEFVRGQNTIMPSPHHGYVLKKER